MPVPFRIFVSPQRSRPGNILPCGRNMPAFLDWYPCSGRDQEISCQAVFSTAVCHGRRFPGGKSGAIMISGSEAPLSPAAFCAAAGVKAEILDRFRRQERGRCSIGSDQGRDSKQGSEGGPDRGAVRFLLMRGTPACQSGRCLAQAAEGAGPGQPGERRVQDGHGRRRDI